MEKNFVRALGALPSSVSDYRTIPLASVRADTPFLNGVQNFQNDYSMIPVIDQGQEPECPGTALKVYLQKKIFKETGKVADISSRALYQLMRMYGGTPAEQEGAEPFYGNMVAKNVGAINTELVPEDRTLAPDVYGESLDVTLDMITDAIKKQINGYAVPNLTIPEILNAIQFNDGMLCTILIDESWYQYQPGVFELTGIGATLGLHRVLLTGFSTKADGSLWVRGRNSWGAEWGLGGDFEFKLTTYLAKMSEPVVYTLIPGQLLAEVHNLPVKPVSTLSVPLSVGMTNPDVVCWQNILKYEGLFPLGVKSNGTYGALTAAGTLAFKERYAIAPIDALGGNNVGTQTLAKVNELYGSQFKPKVVAWALAAQAHEGYFAPGVNAACPNGSVAWRNKNPGNFKWAEQPNATENGEWACFDTYQHGFNYLCQFLTECATTGLGEYLPTMTLLQFYETYSPDGTAPAYAAQIAKACGVTVDTPIKNLIL